MTTPTSHRFHKGYSDEADIPEKREIGKEQFDNRAKALAYELDRLIKLISYARECCENEFYGPESGLAYKKLTILDKDLKKIKELSTTMGAAVDAKIRFDKHNKQLAEMMTPEEEMEAVKAYIDSLDEGPYHQLRESTKRR